MDSMKKLVRTATAVLVLGLAPVGLSPANAAATDRSQLVMMDDDKMAMPADSSNASKMGQSGNQSMGGGRMDDKMKMQMPQTQDCQGPGCPQQSSNMMQMMQMMERMMQMRGQMNSSAGAGGSSTNTASGPADVTERIEGRLAFLKTELQVTDRQTADWNALADALRSGRQHLLEARKLLVMDDKVTGTERVEHYERHLSERLEAIKTARAAFNKLYPTLSDNQKQTADTILLPLIATF
jgi:hypothetical protein